MCVSKLKSIVCMLAMTVCLFGCQEDEQPSALIVTLDPEVVNNTTVTLKALLKTNDSEEYGFVWDGLPDPDDFKNKIAFYNNPPLNTEITANLNNLDLDETYYVRAYSKKGNDITYGDQKSFVFGGLTPEITKLLPNTAHLGDTIQIIGKNFSALPERMVIQFKSLVATIVDASSDTITCIVPSNLSPGSHPVKVKVGNKSSATILFTILHPEIINVTPTTATFLDLVVIQGNNFHKKASNNKVMFGSAQAEIVQASAVSLTVKVPVQLTMSPVTISVQVDSQKVEAEIDFTLLPMSVSTLEPMTERMGNMVTITGSNFNPSTIYNEVLFGLNKAVVVESSSTQLKVVVPNGIYADDHVTVQVKVGGTLEEISPFIIKNAWIRRPDIAAGIFGRWGGKGFVINGKGYAGIGGGAGASSAYQDFYRFDDNLNSWTRVADFGGGKRYWAASFEIDNKAYVGTGSVTTSGEGTNDFYKYDPQNNTWTRIADFPGSPSSRAVGFSINGKGYLCLPTVDNNFWEYDPILNTWTQKETLVTSPWGGSKKAVGAFVLKGRAFVLTSLHSSGELYEYDVNNNAWIRKNDVSATGNLPAVVSTDSHAYYIVDYYAREYDIETDTWSAVDFDPVPSRNDAFFFGIGEKIFIGGGRENSYKDFWECDTSKL